MSDTHSLDVTKFAKNRHTVKAYDGSKTVPQDKVEQLKTLLQLSPSSINLQPWHFIMASTDEGKDRIAKSATDEKYPFNSGSIRNASHVVVFASRLAVEDDYLKHLMAVEDKDGRYDADSEEVKAERKAQMAGARDLFINIHKHDLKDVQHWMDKQVYLNMGQFMLGAAALGLDTTPMEGIDPKGLDAEFGLRDKGFNSLALVCVGYNDPEEDYNAHLPKSRLPISEIITEV